MLPPALVQQVLGRLGLSAPPIRNAEGLATLYSAWCARVPFDNVRKLTALHGGAPGSLPGMDAEEFFEAWLAHGCGATCWPGSNALCELLLALGFDCQRAKGSMRDCGRTNHGSVVVRLDRASWLADSSMLTHAPLPLADGVFLRQHPVHDQEVEAQGAEYVIWNDFAPTGFLPCRIFAEVPNWTEYQKHYEGSREMSPFNRRVYARRTKADRVSVLSGSSFFVRSDEGVARRELAAAEVLACLADEFGLSSALLDAWVASGAAAVNLEPPPANAPPPPVVAGVRPSQRGI